MNSGRSLELTLVMCVGMVIFYLVDFAYIPYATIMRDGHEVTYRATTLHLFVIAGALYLGPVPALVLGIAMSAISLARAITVLPSIDALSVVNMVAPRLFMALATSQIVLRLRNRNASPTVVVSLAAGIGTLAHTVTFVPIAWMRFLFTDAFEEHVLGLTFPEFFEIARKNFSLEIGMAIVLFNLLELFRGNKRESPTSASGSTHEPLEQVVLREENEMEINVALSALRAAFDLMKDLPEVRAAIASVGLLREERQESIEIEDQILAVYLSGQLNELKRLTDELFRFGSDVSEIDLANYQRRLRRKGCEIVDQLEPLADRIPNHAAYKAIFCLEQD